MTETAAHVTRCFASLLLLIGATLLIIGNTTHPIDTDPTATSRLDLATAGAWMAIHLTIAIGVLTVVAGLTVLSGAVDHPLGAAYARLGATAAIVGGSALAIVFGALDGYGYVALAAESQRTGGIEREAIETVALALDTIDSGMTALGILCLFGIAMATFGIAIVTSGIVSRWLGWVALLIGLVGTVTGLLFATLGPTALVINGLFRPLAMATTLYFVVLAVALRRRPPGPAVARHERADRRPGRGREPDVTGSLSV
jgi:hypothetical protein